MSTLAVIIPVFNKWELTKACLLSLAAHTPPGIRPARIIVADNGSTDETPEACLALGSELFGESFAHLRFNKNRNFGPACNAAASLADTDLLFFLNNDTLLTPDWLPPLLAEMESDAAPEGTGPLLTYSDNTVQHLGIAFWPAGECVGHYLRSLPASHPLTRKKRHFRSITAAALMLRRQRFAELDGFCEGFINGFEDVDLCMRLTAAGGRMTIVPESRVVHLESQTPNRHSGEAHNSLLLRERCDIAACADLDTLAHADGYTLRVEPDLHAMVTVPDKRSLDLLRRSNVRGADRQTTLCRLLEEEPLWEEGYLLLASLLERRGAVQEALDVCCRAGQMAPSHTLLENSLRLAAAQGVDLPDLAIMVEDSRAKFMDKAKTTQRLKLICGILRNYGREYLIPRYEEGARKAATLRAL